MMTHTKNSLLPLTVILFFSCNNNNNNTDTTQSTKQVDTVATTVYKKNQNLPALSLGTIDSGGRKDYTIATPMGWTKKVDTIIKGGRFIKLFSPLENAADQFPDNINVITETLLKPGLDNYFKSSKTLMLKDLPGVIFKGEGDTVINKEPAKWMTVIFAGNHLVTYKVLIYLLIRNGFGYCITCTSTDPGFEKYERTFKDAAGSFKIGQ
ncbi:MAG: hypothetical protein ABJA78_05770 [Ferruginibacter sp.]